MSVQRVGYIGSFCVTPASVELDNANDVGTATGGVLEFKGVPFLAAPYLSFPLSDERKTGALPPSRGLAHLPSFPHVQEVCARQ